MRALLLCFAPILLAETWPLEVRLGAQAGSVVFRVFGASVPLVQEGEAWVSTLDMSYRVTGTDGRVLESGTETIPLRLLPMQRELLLKQYLTITRKLTTDPAAVELQVSMTAQPSGTIFAGVLRLQQPSFQVDSEVALVPFQVERSGGKMAAPLTSGDIQVLEDGVPQTATVYPVGGQSEEAMPVDISLLYDRSGMLNTRGRYPGEVFRKGLLDEFPNVRVAVYGFSDHLTEFAKPTRDEAVLGKATSAVTLIPGRSAPLFSSIETTIERFDMSRPAVRILVVFSPGVPTQDPGTFEAAMRAAQKAGVVIYPVLMEDGGMARASGQLTAEIRGRVPRSPRMTVAGRSSAEFRRLAESGGRNLSVLPGGSNLQSLFADIAKTLRQMYVASYQPAGKGKASAREVQVVLRDKQMGKVLGGVRTVVR